MPKPTLLLDLYIEPGAHEHFAPWVHGELVTVRPADGPLPPIEEFSGMLISGSAASIVDEDPWAQRSAEQVRAALARDVPVLGCCFGHQLLAYAVGGIDAVEKATGPEVGYPHVRVHTDDPLLSVLPPSFRTFVSHEDQVRPHPSLQVLADTEDCAVHAIRVPDSRAWGVQFHVEYPLDEQTRILLYRADKHPELGIDPDAVLANRADSTALARALFARFQEIARSD